MDPYRDPPAEPRSILVVGVGGQLVGLDAATGVSRWRNMLPSGGIGAVHIAFRYDALVVSPDDNVVYRIDYQTGRTLWTRTTTAPGRATILIEPGVIVVTKGGSIDAFEHDGTRRWRHSLRAHGSGPAALAFPGNVAQAEPLE